jgi:hypothetical protein
LPMTQAEALEAQKARTAAAVVVKSIILNAGMSIFGCGGSRYRRSYACFILHICPRSIDVHHGDAKYIMVMPSTPLRLIHISRMVPRAR